MESKQQHFIGGTWLSGGERNFTSVSPVDDSDMWQGAVAYEIKKL